VYPTQHNNKKKRILNLWIVHQLIKFFTLWFLGKFFMLNAQSLSWATYTISLSVIIFIKRCLMCWFIILHICHYYSWLFLSGILINSWLFLSGMRQECELFHSYQYYSVSFFNQNAIYFI
jgi:hypothetical protein